MEGVGNSSEDCLFLNVVAPTAAGPHPVVVYLHAGEFHVPSGRARAVPKAGEGGTSQNPCGTTGLCGTSCLFCPCIVTRFAAQYGAASDRESDWPFADDIVLVTPNSRLGAFGYLASDDLRGLVRGARPPPLLRLALADGLTAAGAFWR